MGARKSLATILYGLADAIDELALVLWRPPGQVRSRGEGKPAAVRFPPRHPTRRDGDG
jgi:hypothetical protein